MATGTLAPTPILIAQDANGLPVSGAKAYWYLAGTSTPATVYTDVGLTVAHANPVVANGFGRFAEMFLSPGASYKLDLQTPAGVSLSGYPADNIAAVPASSGNIDITGFAGEALTAGQAVYLDTTTGQWFKGDNTNTSKSVTPPVGIVVAAIASGASGTIRLSGRVTGLSSLVVGSTYYVGVGGALTSTAPTNRRELGKADSTSSLVLEPWATRTAPAPNGICQARITLASNNPVPAADVIGATILYVTPYAGNRMSVYDGVDTWNIRTFTETAVPLGTLVNAQAYDVFAYEDSVGAIAFELAEWANAVVTMTIAAPTVITWTGHGLTTGMSITFTTSGTLPTGVTANTQYWVTTIDANTFKISTSLANVAAGTFIAGTVSQSGVHTAHQPQARATGLVLQDGILAKSGATTRRYLGTVMTTSTTTFEDSYTKRLVSNYYNRVRRPMRVLEATDSWPYTLAAYRQANGSALNQLAVIVAGVASEVVFDAVVCGLVSNTNAGVTPAVAIGENSTAVKATGCVLTFTTTAAGGFAAVMAHLRTYPAVGYNAYPWLEFSSAVGTTTWYGDNGGTTLQSGMVGSIEG